MRPLLARKVLDHEGQMKPGDDWHAAWDDYRRRRGQSFVLWIAGVPALGLAFWWLSRRHPLNEPLFWIVGMPIVAVLAIASTRRQVFTCPRCRKPFGLRLSGLRRPDDSFGDTCLHCGIRVGDDPSKAKE